jgi:hypothetical protein
MQMKIEKDAIYFYKGGECIGAYYGENVARIASIVRGANPTK